MFSTIGSRYRLKFDTVKLKLFEASNELTMYVFLGHISQLSPLKMPRNNDQPSSNKISSAQLTVFKCLSPVNRPGVLREMGDSEFGARNLWNKSKTSCYHKDGKIYAPVWITTAIDWKTSNMYIINLSWVGS